MQYKLPIGIALSGLIIAVVIAILGWAVLPKVIDDKIAEQTQLKDGSETLEKWADIPYPIYLTFYVFHVANPDAIEQNGTKPVLQQRGPYVYRQTRIKVNMTHNDLDDPEGTLQYKERKTYFFDQKLSGKNTENDTVNVINIAFVAVVHGVRAKLEALTDLVANGFLGTETLIKRNVRVGDLLFDGFNVSLYTNNPVLALALPTEFSEGRFGLYKGENGTDSKEFNIYTGAGETTHRDFGMIKEYDGKEQLEFWIRNTTCDRVVGTDGSIYPPFLDKNRKIDVFSTDLCRSLRFTYKESVEYKDVPAWRFTVPKWTLEDPRINEENMCYCLTNITADCPRAGAMSLEGCREGAPIMMSTPYFLDGYEGYLNDSGLPKPDPELHLTYLDIEPNSGVLLRGHKRIQVNIQVKIGTGVNAYKGLKKDIVFPLVWADEHAEMDDESVDDLKGMLIKPVKIINIARWALLGVGIAIFIAGAALFVIKRRQGKVTV